MKPLFNVSTVYSLTPTTQPTTKPTTMELCVFTPIDGTHYTQILVRSIYMHVLVHNLHKTQYICVYLCKFGIEFIWIHNIHIRYTSALHWKERNVYFFFIYLNHLRRNSERARRERIERTKDNKNIIKNNNEKKNYAQRWKHRFDCMLNYGLNH